MELSVFSLVFRRCALCVAESFLQQLAKLSTVVANEKSEMTLKCVLLFYTQLLMCKLKAR